MLKLIPIPNPFKLAFSSYKMTDLGKILLGSMVAQAISNTVETQEVATPAVRQCTPEDEVWSHYEKVLKSIDSMNGYSINNFMNLNKDAKKSVLITLFTQTNRTDLIPALQRYVFPNL